MSPCFRARPLPLRLLPVAVLAAAAILVGGSGSGEIEPESPEDGSCLLQSRSVVGGGKPSTSEGLSRAEADKLRAKLADAEAEASLWRDRALRVADYYATGSDRKGLEVELAHSAAKTAANAPSGALQPRAEDAGAQENLSSDLDLPANNNPIVDIPILDKELYLVPHLNEILPFQESKIAKQFVFLLKLVDLIPAWLANIFTPLVLPGGDSITINIDQEVDTSIHVGPLSIPTPMSLWILSAQVQNLNELTVLRPLSLVQGGSFSFEGHLAMKRVKVIVEAKLTVLLSKMDVTITVDVAKPSIAYMFIIAFQKQRICEAFGETMLGGLGCAMYPFFTKEAEGALWWKKEGVSGFRIEDFNLTMDDFNLNIDIKGGTLIGMGVRKVVEDLEKKLNDDKATIYKWLQDEKNKILVEDFMNSFIAKNLLDLQRNAGRQCILDTFKKISPNVSRVCINNNAGFGLKWDYQECSSFTKSQATPVYPAAKTTCIDVQSYLPYAKPGGILRTQTMPVLGVVQMPDPPLTYVPDSNSAGFECAGSTLLYSCKYMSLVPVNPLILPEAQKFCVVNQAGFAMYTDAVDLRTWLWAGRSYTYSYSQKYCGDFGTTQKVMEGDQFRVQVQAIGGNLERTNREVIYKINGLTVTYVCRGSTTKYSCDILA
eukprot:TRINITY_DN6832_c3_g1_i1.p1 TRINITY_DN6832_c3_g1~~TRINITY_DN6832_c3_g1_i1.p1  ORF type:complete len:658 (-),score=164.57 TRINITY_DN6832_c3_g1_i1:135-2108(-)